MSNVHMTGGQIIDFLKEGSLPIYKHILDYIDSLKLEIKDTEKRYDNDIGKQIA